jgi:phosphoribosylglycinamide formyltransferase-1
MTVKFGVLVSGGGTNLQAILDRWKDGSLGGEVCVVISNRPKAFALQRARDAGVPAVVVSHRRYSERELFEQALIAKLREYRVDWVVLAGFMRILTPCFLSEFRNRVINVHPALLPAFPGVDAQKQAFDYGVKIAGCTVHLVDEGTDTGPILAQATVEVRDDDDAKSLKERILHQEHRLLPGVLQAISLGGIEIDGRRARLVHPVTGRD